MKNNQKRKAVSNIASLALWRARRKEQCKRIAQEEISTQRAIEEHDRALLRQFKAFI
ncbi:TPA: hypothetical protein ACI7CY_004756 [Escherichia coli]